MLQCILFIINVYKEQMNKENSFQRANTQRSNSSLPHPSKQSQSSQYRPSIKVGYKVIPNIVQEKRARRRIQPCYSVNERVNCKKMNADNKIQVSGKFMGSEYIKDSQSQTPFFHKKGVAESRDKYQSGEGVKEQIMTQCTNKNSRKSSSVASVTSSRSRNNLPSYQYAGIKDIMEYHHALPYREAPITQKCTNNSVLSRFCKFNDLHEFDFRKKPEFLR